MRSQRPCDGGGNGLGAGEGVVDVKDEEFCLWGGGWRLGDGIGDVEGGGGEDKEEDVRCKVERSGPRRTWIN